MTTMTVHSGPERRRWAVAEKLRIIEESLAAGSIAEVARRHDIHPNLLHLWRRQARSGALRGARADGSGFMPVTIAAQPAQSDTQPLVVKAAGPGAIAEVLLRNGRVLRLPEEMAPSRVIALADALEGIGQ